MEVEQNSDWIVPENRKSKQEITPLVKSLSGLLSVQHHRERDGVQFLGKL